MRLKISRATAGEKLSSLQNDGYELLNKLQADYKFKRSVGQFDAKRDNANYRREVNQWAGGVVTTLTEIFPTNLEANVFRNAPSTNITYKDGENAEFGTLNNKVRDLIDVLHQIITVRLDRYTDLPIKERLYVDHIDSFSNVRDVHPDMVSNVLDNGYLSYLEDDIQRYFEEILSVPFHQKDWGGEINDLYASTLTVNGQRVATAFLLKGRGLKRKTLRIKDCGDDGSQIVRLFESPAQLFVVQFVGVIDQMVIKDVEGKVAARKAEGKPTWFSIIDGQDTARILYAYGKLRSDGG